MSTWMPNLRCTRLSLLLASALGVTSAASSGCGDEDQSFVPLSQLCTAVAEDLCNARNGGCCAPVDPVTCMEAEKARCEPILATLEAESGRSYDSRAAARQQVAVRALLDACGATPSLSTYFAQGLPLGAACERPSQCASGACSGTPAVCSEQPGEPVCRP